MDASDRRLFIIPLGIQNLGRGPVFNALHLEIDIMSMQHPEEQGELGKIINCASLFSSQQQFSDWFSILTECLQGAKLLLNSSDRFKSLTYCHLWHTRLHIQQFIFLLLIEPKTQMYLKSSVMNQLVICKWIKIRVIQYFFRVTVQELATSFILNSLQFRDT